MTGGITGESHPGSSEQPEHGEDFGQLPPPNAYGARGGDHKLSADQPQPGLKGYNVR